MRRRRQPARERVTYRSIEGKGRGFSSIYMYIYCIYAQSLPCLVLSCLAYYILLLYTPPGGRSGSYEMKQKPLSLWAFGFLYIYIYIYFNFFFCTLSFPLFVSSSSSLPFPFHVNHTHGMAPGMAVYVYLY